MRATASAISVPDRDKTYIALPADGSGGGPLLVVGGQVFDVGKMRLRQLQKRLPNDQFAKVLEYLDVYYNGTRASRVMRLHSLSTDAGTPADPAVRN